jgi:hypothetical protein
MKSIQKVKRVQLKVDHKEDLVLLGLVSSEPDYKLSLSINRKTGIFLRNLAPLTISGDNGSELTFSRFSDSSRSSGMTFNLFSNRSGKSFLLNKLKNIDYILLIHEPENKAAVESVILCLKELDTINAVFNIEVDNFKDKNLQFLTH